MRFLFVTRKAIVTAAFATQVLVGEMRQVAIPETGSVFGTAAAPQALSLLDIPLLILDKKKNKKTSYAEKKWKKNHEKNLQWEKEHAQKQNEAMPQTG